MIYTFTGTKINKSLCFMLNQTGREVSLDDHSSSFEIEIDMQGFKSLIKDVNQVFSNIDNYLVTELNENESLIGFSKWGRYLSIEFQTQIVKERYFDFENAIENVKPYEFNKTKLIYPTHSQVQLQFHIHKVVQILIEIFNYYVKLVVEKNE